VTVWALRAFRDHLTGKNQTSLDQLKEGESLTKVYSLSLPANLDLGKFTEKISELCTRKSVDYRKPLKERTAPISNDAEQMPNDQAVVGSCVQVQNGFHSFVVAESSGVSSYPNLNSNSVFVSQTSQPELLISDQVK